MLNKFVKPLTKSKYKINFSKARLAAYPVGTMYYSKVITFLQIWPHLLQFTYKVNLKMPQHKNSTKKFQKFTRALLAMLMTFRMSEQF